MLPCEEPESLAGKRINEPGFPPSVCEASSIHRKIYALTMLYFIHH